MIRYMIIVCAVLLACNSTSWAVDAGSVFSQKDFARLIFKQLSWEDGLSGEPTDRDYLQILGGRRTFRYEAENAYNEATDRVTVRDLGLYGPYTGQGWLLGVSDTTTTNFTALLPLKGDYTLKAVIKGNGFVWNMGGKDYRADSNSALFKEITIGNVPLKAGVVSIRVSIPPEGAIDSFSFSDHDHAPIQPVAGWRFKEALTAGKLAEIALSMTGRQEQLPDSTQETPLQLAVFEVASLPPNAARTDAAEFGKFTSRQWVRADYRGASIPIPVKMSETGYYAISANLMGGSVAGSVNQALFEVSASPSLEKTRLGLFRLESGDNLITLNLPPMGGVDVLEIVKKDTSSEAFLRLSGIRGPAERLIGADEAAVILKTILDSYPVRK